MQLHERHIEIDDPPTPPAATVATPPTQEQYTVKGHCENCGFNGDVNIPKGTPVGTAACPKCGCTSLIRNEHTPARTRGQLSPEAQQTTFIGAMGVIGVGVNDIAAQTPTVEQARAATAERLARVREELTRRETERQSNDADRYRVRPDYGVNVVTALLGDSLIAGTGPHGG